MKKPMAYYSKGEIGRVRIVDDFLPSPDRLVLREENVKVTLNLSQRSVAFFKRAARQRRVSAHDPCAGGCICGKAGREGVMASDCVNWRARRSGTFLLSQKCLERFNRR
jgi:hypothetical protein